MKIKLDIDYIIVNVEIVVPGDEPSKDKPFVQDKTIIQRSMHCASRKEAVALFKEVMDEFALVSIEDADSEAPVDDPPEETKAVPPKQEEVEDGREA
jgi:hypothetical protein